jgi:cytochrome c oxidase subunit III
MTAASLAHGAQGEVDQLYIETRELRLQGFLLFLVSDCVLFSSFIQRLDVAFAAWNSVVLFGSGATMHYALENFKHGHWMRYMGFLLLTIVLGAGFLGGQGYEYTNLIYREHVTWAGSGIFGASFFTLTGMHGFHVFIGICYLTVLVLQSAAGVYTRGKFFGITAGTLYWHFVDVIWVVLFSIFYLL